MEIGFRNHLSVRFFIIFPLIWLYVFLAVWPGRAAVTSSVGPLLDFDFACPEPLAANEHNPNSSYDARLGEGSKRLAPLTVHSLAIDIKVVDANPLYFPSNDTAWQDGNGIYPYVSGPLSVNELEFQELASMNVHRTGAAADGESQLLLILSSKTAGTFSTTTQLNDFEEGNLLFFREGRTCSTGEDHLSFALYTPPNDFGKGSGQRRPSGRIGAAEARALELDFLFTAAGTDTSVHEQQVLQIVRPPVILVHGLFDEPVHAWMTGANVPVGPSLNYTLKTAGFETFLVDYHLTNGRGEGRDSSFDDNKFVVWNDGMHLTSLDSGPGSNSDGYKVLKNADSGETAKGGGIRQALAYYRDTLQIAATQADVIGHSMGGILARVNGSFKSDDAYNPDYIRADNFWAGDINRIITIDTPHFGSGQPEVFEQLVSQEIEGESWAASLYRSVAYASTWILAVSENSKAVQDLKLESPALKRIGETEIPSHVIASVAREGGQRDYYYDPDGRYIKLLQILGALFYFFPEHLDAYFATISRDWEGTGFEDDFWKARQNIQAQIDSEYEFWIKLRTTGREDRGFMGRQNGAQYSSQIEEILPYPVLETLRTLMFRFDKNDATVRLGSQLGGIALDSSASTYVDVESRVNPDIKESVLHSYAQRYPRIQRHVVKLLKDGVFAAFLPEAGQFMPGKEPVVDGIDWQLTRSFAKKWSGMVFSHADAFFDVAQKEKVIIMTRPVNPDATPLIRRGEATKGMNVKGKSSNWGPQKGYIPADQTYSKLWGKPAADIEEYAKKTSDMLKGKKDRYTITPDQLKAYILPGDPGKINHPIAIAKPLAHLIDNQLYTVWARPGTDPDSGKTEAWITTENAREWVFLCQEQSAQVRTSREDPCSCPQWYNWQTSGDEFDITRQPTEQARLPDTTCDNLRPLEVLADNAHPEERYLTADYDLLAFGFLCPKDDRENEACRGLVKINPKDHTESCGENATLVEAFTGKLWAPPDPFPCFDIHKGLITEAQKDILNKLNEAVRNKNYGGGNVSHHGPETNFNESPYVDYPIVVFDPGATDGNNNFISGTEQILAIQEGPKGFRDLFLKRYFESKIRQGFWIYPNTYMTANWYWNKRLVGGRWAGWEPEDDILVPQGKSAKQLEPPECVQTEIDRLARRPKDENSRPVPCLEGGN